MSLFLEKVISDNTARDGTLATDLTKVCSSCKLVVVVVSLWKLSNKFNNNKGVVTNSFVQKYNFFFLEDKSSLGFT